MLGLTRGTVVLCPHDPEWEREAERTAARLRAVFGNEARIEHVGSTAVRGIRAKPIVDLAVGLRDPSMLPAFLPALAEAGFLYRGEERPGEFLLVLGEGEIRTHHIHVLPLDSRPWRDYIAFRDILNARPDKAEEYDRLKGELAGRYADDRASYTAGKAEFIRHTLDAAGTDP